MTSYLLRALPSIGIIVFIALYAYASTLDPGGSQYDVQSVGYDWFHNYWCNLLSTHGMNGDINPARPHALVAWIVLCVSLALFFCLFSYYFVQKGIWTKLIPLFGGLSMLSAAGMFTVHHDLMTLISSVFGLVVVIGIIQAIYRSDMHRYKISGLVCILLLAANNVIYYTTYGLFYLPILQKISMAMVLVWIIGLNNMMIFDADRRTSVGHTTC